MRGAARLPDRIAQGVLFSMLYSVLVSFVAAPVYAEDPFSRTLEISLENLSELRAAADFEKHGLAALSGQKKPPALHIPIKGERTLRVELAPHTLTQTADGGEAGGGIYHFKGDFEGRGRFEFARISLYDREEDGEPIVSGLLAYEGTYYHIDTVNRYLSPSRSGASRHAVELVVSELDYAGLEDLRLPCGAEAPPNTETRGIFPSIAGMHGIGGGFEIAAASGLREVEMAIDADYRYFQKYGGNTNAEIQSLINAVDGIYESQLNLSLKIVHQNIWTTNTDPYRASVTNEVQMLEDFHANNALPNADYKHLFSGRSLQHVDKTGVAYIGGMCSSFNTGLTVVFGSTADHIYILAHEIAHGLGANHTGLSGPCQNGDIMCDRFMPGANTFVTQTKNEIGNFLNTSGSCITAPVTSSYSVSGSVLTDQQSGLNDVIIRIDGGGIVKSTRTNAAGQFVLTDVPNGSHTVTATLDGWTFSPSSRQVVVSGGNVSGIAFTASNQSVDTYSLSGTVTRSSGSGISGVTLQLSGPSSAAITTDSSGAFTFSGLQSGTYSVTASKSGWTFSPSSRSVTIANGNVTGVTFTGTAPSTGTYSISGFVTGPGGAGIFGATVQVTGISNVSASTGFDGSYTLSGLNAGTYTVSASRAGWTFSPASRQVLVTNGNVSGISFSGTQAGGSRSISGFVRDAGGAGVPGVLVQLSGSSNQTATTDSSGAFLFSQLASGDYTVTPSKPGVAMNPASRTVPVGSANVTNVNFTTTSVPDFTGYCPNGIQSPDQVNEGEIFEVTVVYANDSGTDWLGYAAANWDFTRIPLIYADPEYYGPNRDFPFRRAIPDPAIPGAFKTEFFAFEFLIGPPEARIPHGGQGGTTITLQAPFVNADTDFPLVVQPFRVIGNELVEFPHKCGKVVRVLNR